MKSCGEINLLLRSAGEKSRETCVSDLAKNIDSHLLDKLLKCITEVNAAIETTSALPGYEDNATEVQNTREQIDKSIFSRLKNMSEIKEKVLLKLLNLGIKAHRAGNCYEFSFFGQSILEKEGASAEIFRIKGDNTKDSHVFIIVNRNQGSNASDFNTWNKDTIVVDTYMKQIYFSNEIPIYLKSCLYDEETSKVNYIPFNSTKHTLDNKIQNELLEDWQQVMEKLKPQKTDVNKEEAQIEVTRKMV